ncbi:MAG: gamma-glutamyltransferase [Acidobacteria bacterium]|nr:gamma-glutamyltransferase [Acidobacteriota bacterium]MBV9475617.1 gamma-glutamyltransferase [Acidobacteriota bacterium]
MNRRLALLVLLLIPHALQAASREPVRAPHGMVSCVSPIASHIGADVLAKGGNAVDAAVAVGFALAVTWPSAGNLGGGGFMLVRTADGNAIALDYRERAPLAATRTMYVDANGKVIPKLSTQGYKAVGVPGTVAGLALAHKRWGKLPWKELIAPAQKLAADGFTINYMLAKSLAEKSSIEKMEPFADSKRIFLNNGKPYVMGDKLVQPELARVLARIATDPRDFYEGATAKQLVDDMRAHGGLVTAEDLRTYEPTLRTPLRTTYRGYEILTMPPPSSGGIALIEMLHMLEPYDLGAMGWHSSQHVHLMTEVMRRAFADRAQFLGDTDFVKVPVAALTSAAFAESRRKTIDPEHATPSATTGAGDPAPYESTQTTHFCVIDAQGNAVSNTYTLNDSYGAGVTATGLGFLLNDEMDDFSSAPGTPNYYGLIQGEANSIAPRKRPLSSMTPAIVLKDNKLAYALGSPGGPTIINTVLQLLVNVIDFKMNIAEAVSAPRIHHQWLPDELYWEPFDLQGDTRAALERMGHKLRAKAGFADSDTIGDAQMIGIDTNGTRMGAADTRRGGEAAGD